jgi:hypothetical protein
VSTIHPAPRLTCSCLFGSARPPGSDSFPHDVSMRRAAPPMISAEFSIPMVYLLHSDRWFGTPAEPSAFSGCPAAFQFHGPSALRQDRRVVGGTSSAAGWPESGVWWTRQATPPQPKPPSGFGLVGANQPTKQCGHPRIHPSGVDMAGWMSLVQR